MDTGIDPVFTMTHLRIFDVFMILAIFKQQMTYCMGVSGECSKIYKIKYRFHKSLRTLVNEEFIFSFLFNHPFIKNGKKVDTLSLDHQKFWVEQLFNIVL